MESKGKTFTPAETIVLAVECADVITASIETTTDGWKNPWVDFGGENNG